MHRTGFRRSFRKPEVDCRCGHPRICHYTKEGSCVYQKCDCKEFKGKGRPEYNRVRKATCSYGHAHDSGLEIKTCFDLHCLKAAGEIRDFEFHRTVDLPGPSGHVLATYETDFLVEYTDGSMEFIECKGDHLIREMGWRLKWALLQDKHRGDPKYRFRIVTG